MERGTKALLRSTVECYGGSASQNRKGHGTNHTELTRFARRRGDVPIPRSVIFLPREANEKKAEKISWNWLEARKEAQNCDVAFVQNSLQGNCLERWIHCTYGFDY